MTTRKANRDVINQFVREGPKCPDLNGYGNVSVRRGQLRSYRATIAEWHNHDGGITLVVNAGWDGYSPTTSKHMKYLYDAVTGNCESYAYKRDDFTHESGYENDRAAVPLSVSWDGKGRRKARWRRLEDREVKASTDG